MMKGLGWHIIAPPVRQGPRIAGQPDDWRWRTATGFALAAVLLCGMTVQVAAAQDLDAAGKAFAENCFNPYLTAETAANKIGPSGARLDFYDLRPFSAAPPSPVTGRAATPGTDRRCEVAFDGGAPEAAQMWVLRGVAREGLDIRVIDVPGHFPLLPTTVHAAAVQLNPKRIAITQVGQRPGPNGPETFLSVERLTPLEISK